MDLGKYGTQYINADIRAKILIRYLLRGKYEFYTLIPVLCKQNINLGTWHTDRPMPSKTRPNKHFNQSAHFVLVKKYFLIVAANFGTYTKAIITLNPSKIKIHKRDTTSHDIISVR